MSALETTKVAEEEEEEEVTETAGTTATADDPHAEDDGDDGEEDEHEEKAENPFYRETDDPRVFILRYKPPRKGRRSRGGNRINMHVDRCKRLLRGHGKISVHGIEEGMATACTVVEILKREKIAVVESMHTNLNVQARYGGGQRRSAYFAGNYLSLDFVLTRGENAAYVTDGKQRKLIALFEQIDTEKTGKIPKSKAEELEMGDAFYSTDEEKAAAAEYAAKLGAELSLPDFIKYASLFISHNLRVPVFRRVCEEKYGVPDRRRRRKRAGSADKSTDSIA